MMTLSTNRHTGGVMLAWGLALIGALPMVVAHAQDPNALPTEPLTVTGHVVDDVTGKAIEHFIIQGGHIDEKLPGGVEWGYSETRSSGSAEGQFSTTITPGSGWTARILADGYVPQPIVELPVVPGKLVTPVTLRLKRGPTISGRVLRHDGTPAADARVFPIGPTSLNLAGGTAWRSFGPEATVDPDHLGAPTNKTGRFTIPAGEASRFAISSPTLDLFVAEAPADLVRSDSKDRPKKDATPDDKPAAEDTPPEWTITLPAPATVNVHFEVPGALPGDVVFFQLLTHAMPGWSGAEVVQYRSLGPDGRLTLSGLTPGKYQFVRSRSLRWAGSGRGEMLDRTYLDLAPDTATPFDVVRPEGSPVTGVIEVGKEIGLAGVMLSVNSLDEVAPPWGGPGDSILFDSRVLYDGAAPLTDHALPFTTEQLAPGRYRLKVDGYAPFDTSSGFRSGLTRPVVTAQLEIKIPSMGSPDSVALTLGPSKSER